MLPPVPMAALLFFSKKVDGYYILLLNIKAAVKHIKLSQVELSLIAFSKFVLAGVRLTVTLFFIVPQLNLFISTLQRVSDS